MYITHFVCHCYLVRRNFRLTYCNECPLVWTCDEWVKSLSISQPVLHSTPVFTVAGDRWPTVPFAATQAAASSPFPAFLLPTRSSGGTRAAIGSLLLRKAWSTRAHSNGCWTPFSSDFCGLQPVRCLKAAAVDWDSSPHQFVGRWSASFYQSNSQCCHEMLDAISFECKMRSKHSEVTEAILERREKIKWIRNGNNHLNKI